MRPLRIIISGGGTGGHIFPAVAIAHALKSLRPDTEILFVGANGKMEMEKVPLEGFKILGLDIAGFNRSSLLKNLMLPFRILKSYMQARRIVEDFKPDVVVGVGGYASFPIMFAAQQKGIATLIQEQNSYAGKSNKILGKKAAHICVAYEDMERFFPGDKLLLTGNPVRKNIAFSIVTRQDAVKHFNLDESKKTILVVGGSLGAKSINEAIDAGLDELIKEGVQLIWQTGKPYIEQARKRSQHYLNDVKSFDFIREMEYAYAAADIVISRAGALAIAELCIVGKPVIFVPYPFASEDHQTSNAVALVSKKAALMVKNDVAKAELINELKMLLHNASLQEELSRNIAQQAIKDADFRIAHTIIDTAKNGIK